MTSARVAESIGASGPHVRALLSVLAGAGLVATAEGRRGGYRLARKASAVRLSDVLRAVEADRGRI